MTNEQLVARIRAGENEAENMLQLWQQNEGFIAKTARRYTGYAEIEDLCQEGYIALCEAVRHYDPACGTLFMTYAAFWVRQGMQRYIENCCSTIRIPSGTMEKVRKYKRISREYMQYCGRELSDREMQGFLGADAEQLDRIRKTAKMGRIRSLSEPVGEEEDLTLADMVAAGEDPEEDTIRRLDAAAMQNKLWIAVDQLPDSLSSVIRYRFRAGKTLKETGEELGISLSAARELENRTLKALRLPKRCQTFRGYYEEYLSAASVHHVGLRAFRINWTSEVEREVIG